MMKTFRLGCGITKKHLHKLRTPHGGSNICKHPSHGTEDCIDNSVLTLACYHWNVKPDYKGVTFL